MPRPSRWPGQRGAEGFPNRIAAAPGEVVVIDGASSRNSGIVATSLAWFEFAGLTFTRTKSRASSSRHR